MNSTQLFEVLSQLKISSAGYSKPCKYKIATITVFSYDGIPHQPSMIQQPPSNTSTKTVNGSNRIADPKQKLPN
ncbi:14403_t:CDS:2 [Ambispora leptoticha]|uniref:14403_t:CDS:1 n=1 Tax=Ambispora leptoticha TaxID=144679 RepID=A0A9N8Z3E2_9GLOM|nr:14403_t:CDS:2 [Ambispora leptoticha]